MPRWGIEFRVLTLAVIPAALIALTLTGYHTHHRVVELEENTIEHARATARQFSALSRLDLATQQPEMLQAASRSIVVENRTLLHIRILDPNGALLASSHQPGRDETTVPGNEGAVARITEEIVAIPTSVGITHAVEGGELLGRVDLVVDLAPVREAQLQALGEGLALSLGALVLIGLVAAQVGRRATRPIHEITRAVEHISSGDLSVKPKVQSPAELGRLERGVASMVEEIRTSQEKLEKRVSAATGELQDALRQLERRNEELDEARRAAETASEFKSRFLANISHEIRTPMNSILGFAGLLRDADLEPVHADYVDTIYQSANSLLSLLNGILDLSKIESGHIELAPEETDLNELLDGIFRLLAPEAFHKGLEFIVVPLPIAQAHVVADPIRIKQILLNLTSNALKFTDTGHILITACTDGEEQDERRVSFRIEDTGCGISADARERLFEAFAQGHADDDAPEHGGTGLGLHIASELVFLMDGSVEFDSEPGVGSVFTITLPLPPIVGPTEPTPADPLPGSGRVLLVEPDARLSAPLARLFAIAGARVTPFSSSAAAARVATRHDVLIVHIRAPAIPSDETPRVTRSLGRSHATVVAYSHIHSASTREYLLECGYREVVSKTANPACLARDISRIAAFATSDSVAESRHSAAATSPPTAGKGHALVVDDHPINRKLLRSYLVEHYHHVETAASGEQGVLRAQGESYDVLLLDLHLPDYDGFEVARRVRNEPGPNRHTPIIAITADTRAPDDGRAADAAVDDILIKPIRQQELITAISRGHARRCTEAPDAPLTEANPTGASSITAAELQEMLRNHLPEARAEIIAAQDAGDSDALRDAAHRLHGAVAYCDEPRLLYAARRVEQAKRDGADAQTLQQCVYELLDAIDAVLPPTQDKPQ